MFSMEVQQRIKTPLLRALADLAPRVLNSQFALLEHEGLDLVEGGVNARALQGGSGNAAG